MDYRQLEVIETAQDMLKSYGTEAVAHCLSILNNLTPDMGRAYYIQFDFYADVLNLIKIEIEQPKYN